jgi:hypothetical protein
MRDQQRIGARFADELLRREEGQASTTLRFQQSKGWGSPLDPPAVDRNRQAQRGCIFPPRCRVPVPTSRPLRVSHPCQRYPRPVSDVAEVVRHSLILTCFIRDILTRVNHRLVSVAIFAVATFFVGCEKNRYEVIERAEKEVPNFQAAGTHSEVDYVLLHHGRKIYATCDATTVDTLDPEATCGFRPLRKYECTSGQDGDLWNAKLPLSDLKCKDADGHNVYLYATKEEIVPTQPSPLITALIALQFVAFGWRINREIPLGDQGRRTWLPLPDYINVLSLFAVLFICAVGPLAGWSSDRLSTAALGAGWSLMAFHPISVAAHYRLFSSSGRSIYLKAPNDDFPWITGQEGMSVCVSLVVATVVAVAGFLS